MKHVSIGTLIEILKLLPEDGLIWLSNWDDSYPLDVIDIESHDGPLFIYEKDGEVRLYIDDGEAFHSSDKYKSSLFWSDGALTRAIKVKNETKLK